MKPLSRLLLTFGLIISPLCGIAAPESQNGQTDREYTVSQLEKIAGPVLRAAADGSLKEVLPDYSKDQKRSKFAPLEAFGRTLCGIAPWLSLGPDETSEGQVRTEFLDLARRGLVSTTQKDSPGRLAFSEGGQALVDTAFLAQALLEAPSQLWDPLSDAGKAGVIEALKETRVIQPGQNNWLLFSALVESAIWKFTGEENLAPIETALTKHEEWYLGDGTYGDGAELHWDYYNSFVIQPAMLAVLDVCVEKGHPLAKMRPTVIERARRYAAVQERMISPEGSYPVIGRSATYRFGAFQHLALMAFRRELPADLRPAGVRCALTAVIRRTLDAPNTLDAQGWLLPGAVGHQPSMRDPYINTGSLYLCLFGMKHLGLPADDAFWVDPAEPWTQKRIWSGEDVPGDHVLRLKK